MSATVQSELLKAHLLFPRMASCAAGKKKESCNEIIGEDEISGGMIEKITPSMILRG